MNKIIAVLMYASGIMIATQGGIKVLLQDNYWHIITIIVGLAIGTYGKISIRKEWKHRF
jgi:hypothetical protein